jgi:hypothetical protein
MPPTREKTELHRQHRLLRQEERAMAGPGGHLARREQRILDRQENAISRRIGR